MNYIVYASLIFDIIICDRPYQNQAEVGNSEMARNPLEQHDKNEMNRALGHLCAHIG